ncbi:MAG: translation initiation factor IF-3 [Patescibacteria group bacterium]|nr:translation initiation factor IF-3 [Patescibacteria group bacterium]
MNNQITAPELRVIDEDSSNLGILKREKALRLAQEKGLDLIEIAPTANPPVARIISFDKFRYQKEKEEKKQRQAQKTKELKYIRISPRAAPNDLQIKADQTQKFLEEGHQVEILLFVRGREKGNKDWNLKKLNEFLDMIKMPHLINLEPKFVGKGFVVQIIKK